MMTDRARRLQRLAQIAGLVRDLRQGQAAAARAKSKALHDSLSDPGLHTPPDPADATSAAQHARWAAARRLALAHALAAAQADLARRETAARRALGVDQAVDGLSQAEAAAIAMRARRG